MIRIFALLFMTATAYVITATAHASPVAHLSKVGQGEMQYLFWTIYQAEYYQQQNTQTATDKEPQKALKIKYLKSIDSQALVKATIEQWQQLGYSSDNITSWVEPLNAMWPDVEPGNTLTLLVQADGHSQFYFNDNVIGTIQDSYFADAFLSIWLSEKTSQPELRQQLLGLTP